MKCDYELTTIVVNDGLTIANKFANYNKLLRLRDDPAKCPVIEKLKKELQGKLTVRVETVFKLLQLQS